jgi:hypothetical protein
MARFGRVGSLVIGKPGSLGSEYTELNFTFDVKKTLTPDMNPGVVTIYNLSNEARAGIHELETVCLVKAGYLEEIGPLELFRGYVASSSSARDGTNMVTTLELRDGYQELREKTFSKSYSVGSDLSVILADVIKSLNLPSNLESRLTTIAGKKLTHGMSYNGLTKAALIDIARVAGLEWSIQSGRLKLLEAGKADTVMATVLSKDTGLIGKPTRLSDVVIDKKKTNLVGEKREKKQLGWQVESLLLPMIEPGNRVQLESEDVRGVFKVVNVYHLGELFGSSWNTKLDVIEL